MVGWFAEEKRRREGWSPRLVGYFKGYLVRWEDGDRAVGIGAVGRWRIGR